MATKPTKTKKVVKTSAKGAVLAGRQGSTSGGKEAKAPKVSDGSLEAAVYNQDGKSAGTITLPENIFGLKWNADLVHQVVTSLMSSKRLGTAHAKTRGEIRGGGKKPWQQKGTGRARHGSTRSPIWRKGGVTHGPRKDKNYGRKVNSKMRVKALHTVLSQKLRDGEVFFLSDMKLSTPKTKEAKVILNRLGSIKGFEAMPTRKSNALMLAISKKDDATEKSFKNIGNVSLVESRNLNVVDLLNYRYLGIIDPASYFKTLGK